MRQPAEGTPTCSAHNACNWWLKYGCCLERSLGQAQASAKSESDRIHFVTPCHRRETLDPKWTEDRFREAPQQIINALGIVDPWSKFHGDVGEGLKKFPLDYQAKDFCSVCGEPVDAYRCDDHPDAEIVKLDTRKAN